jgi:hypothetical protein
VNHRDRGSGDDASGHMKTSKQQSKGAEGTTVIQPAVDDVEQQTAATAMIHGSVSMSLPFQS